MHLFYTPDIEGDIYTLNADESRHCVRVLGPEKRFRWWMGKELGMRELSNGRKCGDVKSGLRIGGNYTAGAIFTCIWLLLRRRI